MARARIRLGCINAITRPFSRIHGQSPRDVALMLLEDRTPSNRRVSAKHVHYRLMSIKYCQCCRSNVREIKPCRWRIFRDTCYTRKERPRVQDIIISKSLTVAVFH
eukprot:scaffold203640_cov32-Tisochrysis_lutea.AAC.4